ncbi:Potassium transporter [Kalmusia sp. IMI 367209]|nr:Potassium transporter [Kalmusia sp. IMI 367209]
MGCCGDREKGITVTEEQKWDYITLSDFKSTSCLTPFSYIWLWILVIISGAVYAADAFTAVNLLAFNKWSSQVKPKVDFNITKWIFAVCIIVSYVFLAYRWIRAIRVLRSGGVAECYLEPLAAIFQSMRLTKEGQGWRRFLVFAELTKSRKGVDYIALFVYFQFKGALIIILAQGPRIAINGLTLWAVMQAQIIPEGDHAAPKGKSPVAQFFLNIETMVQQGNKQETVIYFTMLFSLVIWVIAFLSLFFSVLFYVFFLWHYVPKADGSLTQYCRRKIESRLERIVSKKIKKALEKQDLKRKKEERDGLKKGGSEARMPTLPKLGGMDDDASSIFSGTTGVTRSDTLSTMTTLPPYSSNAPSRTNTMSTARTAGMRPTLPSLNERPVPTRSDTQGTSFSTTSFGSNAPLLGQAGDMGMASPVPPMPSLDPHADYFSGPPGSRPPPNGMPGRPYPSMQQGRASPHPPRDMLPRVDTSFGGRASPASQLSSPPSYEYRGGTPGQGNAPYPNRRPGGPPLNGPTFSPFDNRGPTTGPSYEMSPVDVNSSGNGPQNYYTESNRSDDFRPPQLPQALRPGSPAQSQSSGPPARAGTAPPSNPRAGLPATLQSAIQRREASQPLPNRGMPTPQQRSATAPLGQPRWALESGSDPMGRSNTTSPGPQGYNPY